MFPGNRASPNEPGPAKHTLIFLPQGGRGANANFAQYQDFMPVCDLLTTKAYARALNIAPWDLNNIAGKNRNGRIGIVFAHAILAGMLDQHLGLICPISRAAGDGDGA